MNETTDWTFESVSDVPTLKLEETKSTVVVMVPADQPYTAVIYKDGTEEIGRLDISTGVLKFEGRVDESAAALITAFKVLADKYLAGRI